VDGRAVHTLQAGDGPFTVVFDAGSGGFSLDWEAVRVPVAAFARTIAFDRAGYAWSASRPTPRDAEHTSAELNALLDHLDIRGPIVLVGHSMGGLYAQYFAGAYPERVAGLVLVDSAHRFTNEDLIHFIPEADRDKGTRIFNQYLSEGGGGLSFAITRLIVPPLGLLRLIGVLVGERLVRSLPPYNSLSPAQKKAYRAMVFQTGFLRTRLDEGHLLPRSAERTRQKAPTLRDLPLIVLSGEALGGIPYKEGMLPRQQILRGMNHAAHRAVAELSTRGEHRIVPHSAHYVHVDQPEAVIMAVRDVMDRISVKPS